MLIVITLVIYVMGIMTIMLSPSIPPFRVCLFWPWFAIYHLARRLSLAILRWSR